MKYFHKHLKMIGVLLLLAVFAVIVYPKECGTYTFDRDSPCTCLGGIVAVQSEDVLCDCGDLMCVGVPIGPIVISDSAVIKRCDAIQEIAGLEFYKEGNGFAETGADHLCIPENRLQIGRGETKNTKILIVNQGNLTRRYELSIIDDNNGEQGKKINFYFENDHTLEPGARAVITLKVIAEESVEVGRYIFHISSDKVSKRLHVEII